MTSNRKVNTLRFYLLIFFLIIGVKLKIGFDSTVALSFFIIIAFPFFKKKLSYELLKLFFLFFVYAVFNVMCSAFFWEDAKDSINILIKSILFPLAGFLLATVLYEVGYFWKYINIIGRVVFFHSLIVISMLFFPSFKELIYQYSDVSQLMYRDIGEFRIAGLSGGAGAVLSTFHGIGLICISFYNVNGFIQKAIKITMLLTVFMSMVFIGRTGFLIYVLFFFIYSFVSVNVLGNKLKSTVIKGVVLTILVSFALYASEAFRGEKETTPFVDAINRTTSELTSADGNTKSTFDILFGMTFLPDNQGAEVLIGKGSYGRSDNLYLESDIGYIRMYFYSGVLGIVLALLPFLYVLFLALIYIKNKESKFVFSMILCCLIAEYKEPMLYSRHIFLFLTILLSFYLLCLSNRDVR